MKVKELVEVEGQLLVIGGASRNAGDPSMDVLAQGAVPLGPPGLASLR